MCEEGLKRLTPKVDKWMDKKSTYILVKINEFRCKIKNVHDFWTWGGAIWNEYRDCDKENFSEHLVNKYPGKIGIRIYKNFSKILTTN
jgi:hypothetical protein